MRTPGARLEPAAFSTKVLNKGYSKIARTDPDDRDAPAPRSRVRARLPLHSAKTLFAGMVSVGSAISPAAIPYTLGTVAAGTTIYSVTSITQSIANVERAVLNAESQIATVSQSAVIQNSGDYAAYIGPGLQSGVRIAQQIEHSDVFQQVAKLDFQKISHLLEKIGDSDVDQFINVIGNLIQKLDKIRIHNDVSITTARDDGSNLIPHNFTLDNG